MPQDVSDAFVKQYEKDLHIAFQREGTILMRGVRVKPNIVGSSTFFQKMGTGIAVQKGRNAALPVMNVTHSNVECTLQDWYAPDYVDKLDEEKITIDEREGLLINGARALGRKVDDIIITSMATASTTVAANISTDPSNFETGFLTSLETLAANDALLNEDIYAAIGVKEWTAMLKLASFTSVDYVDQKQVPKGFQAMVRWYGATILLHSGLTVATNVRDCYVWNKKAVGLAYGHEISSEINYVPERVAHLVNNMMSFGSCLIDNAGIIKFQVTEA